MRAASVTTRSPSSTSGQASSASFAMRTARRAALSALLSWAEPIMPSTSASRSRSTLTRHSFERDAVVEILNLWLELGRRTVGKNRFQPLLCAGTDLFLRFRGHFIFGRARDCVAHPLRELLEFMLAKRPVCE